MKKKSINQLVPTPTRLEHLNRLLAQNPPKLIREAIEKEIKYIEKIQINK